MNAVREVLIEKDVVYLEQLLEQAIEASIEGSTLAGPSLEALKNAFTSAGCETSSGITFADFDQYLTFALKIIAGLWGVGLTVVGLMKYKSIWKVVTGRTTLRGNAARYNLAVDELARVSTTTQEAMGTVLQAAENHFSITTEMVGKYTELQHLAQEKRHPREKDNAPSGSNEGAYQVDKGKRPFTR